MLTKAQICKCSPHTLDLFWAEVELALLLSLPQIAQQSIQLLLGLLLLPHRAPGLKINNILRLQLVHLTS